MGGSTHCYFAFGECTIRAEYPHNMDIARHSVLLQTLNVHPIYREGLQGIPCVYNPLYPQHIALINSGSRRQIILSSGHITHVHRPARSLVGEGVGAVCIERLQLYRNIGVGTYCHRSAVRYGYSAHLEALDYVLAIGIHSYHNPCTFV